MIYFASDMHLGNGSPEESRQRERRVVEWLGQIAADATELFLVGDIFDFWYEYKRVVPRGFVRTLGALAALADKGVKIHYFAGNHDMWLRDYFTQELGATIYHRGEMFERCGKRVIAYWHTKGAGKLAVDLGKPVEVALDKLRYLETSLSLDDAKAAWAAAEEK